VVALDLSMTGTGIAATHDSNGAPRLACRTISPRRYPSPTRIDHRRLHEIIAAVMHTVKCRPDLVLIEEPLMVDKGDTSIRLAELHGPVKHWLWSQGVPYVDVHSSQVKTYATGNGGSKKLEVLMAIIARYGRLLHIATHDEADAVSMLAMALDQYGQPLVDGLPNTHRRALLKPTWPQIDLSGGDR
jgi:crossover junction endodeoxyribonuclease RuvC